MASGTKSTRRKPGRSGKPRRAARDEVSSVEALARQLTDLAQSEDPARVAGAIAILAAKTIERSSTNLAEARAYLDGLREAIDGLLRNRFEDSKS